MLVQRSAPETRYSSTNLRLDLDPTYARSRRLVTRRLEEMIRFYTEVIGLKVEHFVPHGSALLVSDGTSLRITRAVGNGQRAFVYLLCNDPLAAGARLTELGVKVRPSLTGVDSVLTEDPDRNILVIRPRLAGGGAQSDEFAQISGSMERGVNSWNRSVRVDTRKDCIGTMPVNV